MTDHASPTPAPEGGVPKCPTCGGPMTEDTPWTGPGFYICRNWPECQGSRFIDPTPTSAEGGEARDGTGDPCVDCGWTLRWRPSIPGYGYCINPACLKHGVDRALYLTPSPTPAVTREEDDCVCSAESLCALHGVMTGVDGLKARLRALHGRVAELRRQIAEAGIGERQGDGTLPYRVEAYHNPAAAELLRCKPWMIYLHLDAGAVSIPIGAGDTEGDAWRSIPALGSTPAPDHGASTDPGASRRTARG